LLVSSLAPTLRVLRLESIGTHSLGHDHDVETSQKQSCNVPTTRALALVKRHWNIMFGPITRAGEPVVDQFFQFQTFKVVILAIAAHIEV